jgi:two-component system sensor histidine kinase YesM
MSYKEAGNRIINKAVRLIYSEINKLQLVINNKKIKTKTIYLYVLCVLFPVLVTNALIVNYTLMASRDEKRMNINNIVESVKYEITSSFESAVYVIIDIYANASIYNFLDTQYTTDGNFLNAYNRIFNNYAFNASSKFLVNGITLYSDNSTMISGGRYFRIDSIKSEEWYKQFIKSDGDIFIYPYYDDMEFNKRRIISVVRKLNYQGNNGIAKIVKLDLNYSMINENIRSSALNTDIYICYGDKVLFYSRKGDAAIKSDYYDVSIIPMDKIQIHKTFNVYGYDYDIYLSGYKSNYNAKLLDNLWILAILLLVDALIPAGMLSLFGTSITKRVLLLGNYMKKVKVDEFELIPVCEGKDEIGELLDNYNLMVGIIKNLFEYEYKSKLEQQELCLARQQAELLALHSQVNPHFMFNVLESIRMHSVIKGEKETSRMIESLARLMRKSAEWGSDLITVDQEISFIEDYLSLQKYRYGDTFNYKIRISKGCGLYMIPSLVLVTFVENSCVHGLNREGHSGTIFISIYEENRYLFIQVEDTGIGMEADQVRELEKVLNEADIAKLQKSTSLGMLNACIRLKKCCSNQTKIIIESEELAGTCIIIKIPIDDIKTN